MQFFTALPPQGQLVGTGFLTYAATIAARQAAQPYTATVHPSRKEIVFRSYVRLGEAVVADGIVIAKNGALDAARGRRCAPAVEVYSALVISFSGPGISRDRRGAAFS